MIHTLRINSSIWESVERAFLFALFLSEPVFAFSQSSYTVESGATAGKGDAAPLWLNANKQGLSSVEKKSGYLAAGFFRQVNSSKITYNYGLELVGASHFSADVFIQQAYLDVNYHRVQFSIGSQERNGELVDQQLSSGVLDFSGNARPIPQIRVELPEYLPVPYTKKWLQIRGHVAYGRFTDGNWQKHFTGALSDRSSGVLYHSKALFLKFANPRKPALNVELGLSMYAQFGGTRYFSDGEKIKMPQDFKSYWKAFLPGHGGKDAPKNDQDNIEGNMLGCYHFSFHDKIGDWDFRPYYEHYFEDQSMMSGKYPWRDGLIGLEIVFPKNRIITKMVLEYFGTRYQSGPSFVKDSDGTEHYRRAGGDDYYNNGIYVSWAHWGQALGNPLLMSPIYNSDHTLTFQSNRMTARHLGLSGHPFHDLSYRILASYTRNWGRYSHAYETVKKEVCTLFELTYTPHQLAGWSFTGAAGLDRGKMTDNSTGFSVTLRKCGVF